MLTVDVTVPFPPPAAYAVSVRMGGETETQNGPGGCRTGSQGRPHQGCAFPVRFSLAKPRTANTTRVGL